MANNKNIKLQTFTKNPNRLKHFTNALYNSDPRTYNAISSLEINGSIMTVEFLCTDTAISAIEAFVLLMERTDAGMARMLNLDDMFVNDIYCACACEPDIELRIMQRVRRRVMQRVSCIIL
jgi:hypothetical protein